MNINPKTDALNNSGKAGDKIDDGIIDDRIFVRISNYDYNPSYDICVEVAKIHGSFFSAFDKSMEFSVDGSCIYAKIPPGTTALRVIEALDVRSPLSIMGVRIDNEPHELTKPLTGNCCLEFIYDNEEEGVRIYRHSLLFMLIKAVYDLYPERTVHICHSISKGLYCEITAPPVYSAPLEMSRRNRGTFISPALSPSSHSNHVYKLTAREVSTIEKRMRQLRDMKISFREHAAQGNDLFRYFYGRLTPHSGYLRSFALKYTRPGLILLFPEKDTPGKIPEFVEQKKLFTIFKEHKSWTRIINAEDVDAVNAAVENGEIGDVIRIAEALHEKKIAHIADMIARCEENKQIILISGPSSSGKTTFAERLSIQLRVNGIRPVTIALDDYFLARDETPLDEDGNRDYESLRAIDVPLFNEQLNLLLEGSEVETPLYDFVNGKRREEGRRLILGKDQVLLIEGIHGLNGKLTESISHDKKFKIYVSALTSMNINDHNRIKSTDIRLIRRIVRDNMRRGANAASTIKRWPSVRRGEDRNIFPFQEEADVMFNSSLVYELNVLKASIEPLLSEIGKDVREYGEAMRLLEIATHFKASPSNNVPLNSILREFIGGSCFHD